MPRNGLYKESSEDPLGSKIYLTSYRILRHAEQVLSEFDITFHGYLTLYYIDKIPRIGMKELGEYLDVSQSIISRTVQNMIEKGLLKRATASDRRKSELALTSSARRKLKAANGKLHELSFLLRHQQDFRIAEIELQLDKLQNAVSIAKERPIIRKTHDGNKGESVLVRLTKKVGGI